MYYNIFINYVCLNYATYAPLESRQTKIAIIFFVQTDSLMTVILQDF